MITKEEAEALEYTDAPDRYAKPAWWADKRLDVLAAGLRRREEQVEKMREDIELLIQLRKRDPEACSRECGDYCGKNKSICVWVRLEAHLSTPPEPIKTEGV